VSPTYSFVFEGNKEPVIENMLWKELTSPQNNWSAYELTVNADDTDGNIPITYEWSIDCGYFSGNTNGQNVVWHYSNIIGCQDAWATITVTDSEGLSVTKTQNVFSLSTFSDEDTPIEEDNISPIISNIQASNITYNSSTITWDTNEQATSQIEYGITTNYGNSTTYNSILKTSHNHYLSGLSDETQYHYRVMSVDSSGNQAISNDYTFTTEEIVSNLDTTPPTISSVSGTTTSYSATITWTTDEASDSQVEYGLTTNYGNSISLDNNLVISHGQIVNGLSDDTVYHYRVKSKDANGNQAVSNDYTFTTEEIVSNIDTTPPTISDIYVNESSSTYFGVAWVTDEFSSTIIQCGLSIDYETQNISDYETLVLNHNNMCSSLEPNTLYHYRVGSTDEAGNTGWSGDMTFTTPLLGAISIGKDSNSPDSNIVIAGDSDLSITKVKFTTTNEDFLVNKLTISIADNIYARSVEGVKLSYNNITTSSPSLNANGSIIFTGLNWIINKNTSEILTIYADFNNIGGGAQPGDEINIGLNCSTAGNCEILSGEVWGDDDNELPDVDGNTMYLRKSKPTISDNGAPNIASSGTHTISEIAVTASSEGAITLKKLSWQIFALDEDGEGLSISDWKIYDTPTTFVESVWSDGVDISTTGDIPIIDTSTNIGGNIILSVEFNNEVEIPAGESKTFRLKCLISGFYNEHDQIVAMLFNNDYGNIRGGLINHETDLVKIDEGNVESSANFIWSDKSCGINHTDSMQNVYKDWFSSYLVRNFRS